MSNKRYLNISLLKAIMNKKNHKMWFNHARSLPFNCLNICPLVKWEFKTISKTNLTLSVMKRMNIFQSKNVERKEKTYFRPFLKEQLKNKKLLKRKQSNSKEAKKGWWVEIMKIHKLHISAIQWRRNFLDIQEVYQCQGDCLTRSTTICSKFMSQLTDDFNYIAYCFLLMSE